MSSKFEFSRSYVLFLCALMLASGCILTEDSPSKRRVGEGDAVTREDARDDTPDATGDASGRDATDDATDSDTSDTSDTDVTDEPDTFESGCELSDEHRRECLRAQLDGKTFAALLKNPPGASQKAGIAMFLEFSYSSGSEERCRVTIETYALEQSQCTITEEGTISTRPNWRTAFSDLPVSVELVPRFSGPELISLQAASLGGSAFNVLPSLADTSELSAELQGRWFTEEPVSQGEYGEVLLGVQFEEGGDDVRNTYGIKFEENDHYQPIIGGKPVVFSCDNEFCWALRVAGYRFEVGCDESSDGIDGEECHRPGDPSATLAGRIDRSDSEIERIYLPLFLEDSVGVYEAEKLEPDEN